MSVELCLGCGDVLWCGGGMIQQQLIYFGLSEGMCYLGSEVKFWSRPVSEVESSRWPVSEVVIVQVEAELLSCMEVEV